MCCRSGASSPSITDGWEAVPTPAQLLEHAYARLHATPASSPTHTATNAPAARASPRLESLSTWQSSGAATPTARTEPLSPPASRSAPYVDPARPAELPASPPVPAQWQKLPAEQGSAQQPAFKGADDARRAARSAALWPVVLSCAACAFIVAWQLFWPSAGSPVLVWRAGAKRGRGAALGQLHAHFSRLQLDPYCLSAYYGARSTCSSWHLRGGRSCA